ncbi:MAG TPA: hypothetical protein VGX68_29475, partial [Thermoanaerobaculia bacterium]|nr:hypothetical protein [Thermoanaerobaculia bacterium]
MGQTLVMIIAAVGALIASKKVSELKETTRRQSERHDEKLDRIETAANGVQTDLRSQVATLEGKIERLYAVVAAVAPNPRALEQATAAAGKLAEHVGPPPAPAPHEPETPREG